MAKFRELKGKAALDALCDLIKPIANIAKDEEAADLFQSKALPEGTDVVDYIMQRLTRAYPALFGTHRKDFIKIASTLNGISEKEYEETCTMEGLFVDISDLMTDPIFRGFFIYAPTQSGKDTSGASLENTKA